MLENTLQTGYSDAEDFIAVLEVVETTSAAAARQLRHLSIDNQQLKKELDNRSVEDARKQAEIERLKHENAEKDRTIADLRRQLAEATKQTITNNITINNAENLAMGDYVQAEIARGVVRDLYKQM